MTTKLQTIQVDETNNKIADSNWRSLYKVCGVAALVMAAIIPIQSFIFIAFPPPTTVVDFFSLFQRNWLLGLLDLDLLYIVDSVLVILIYLALYVALKKTNESFSAIAIVLGMVGNAMYFASNKGFEMLSLSNQFAASTTDAQRIVIQSAGQAMLAIYSGTAFDAYYILSAIALLVFSVVMLQSNIFSKANAYWGIFAGILMIIPSTAGTIGISFGLASLVPWFVWLILFARKLFQIEK